MPMPPPRPPRSPQPSNERHTYIPPAVEAAMTKQIQQGLPGHMKQYAGAYVQQNIMKQGGVAPPTGNMAPPSGYRPVTHLPRESHYNQFDDQAAGTTGVTPTDTGPQPAQATVGGPQAPYDFIMNPEQPKQK